MIRFPLTLDIVARELDRRLRGSVLATAWTQERHVAVLGFVCPDNSELYVQLNTTHDNGTVFVSKQANRARKNAIEIFHAVQGQTLHNVVRMSGDRVVSLRFANHTIHALFYSTGKGNVIVESDTGIIAALHDAKSVVGTPFNPDRVPLRLTKHLELLQKPLEDVANAYLASTTFYVLEKSNEVLFSALPLPSWNIKEEHADVFEAIQRTVSIRRHLHSKSTRTSEVRTQLNAQIKKVQRSLQALDTDAQQAAVPSTLREQAALLMSRPNVDADSIAEAQKLYTKARRAEKAAEERELRRPQLQKQLDALIADLQNLEQGIMPEKTQAPQAQKDQPPYRTFDLGEGYMLYVGRNSANNDQLTMRFAKQNDYWMHVRGQSGSHAVLRSSDSSISKPPKRILEQAASITAYYSSARNASWVPVVYTLRKYVRKPKGAAVGAVTLEREEVVMAKPGLPSGQLET